MNIFNLLKTKYFNIICYSLSAFFLLYFIIAVISSYFTSIDVHTKLNSMLAYCEQYNIKVQEEIKNNPSNEDTSISTEQLYYDGKTAILDAYKRTFYDSTSFKVNSNGLFDLSALGVYAKIEIDFAIDQFSKEKVYEEVKTYVLDSNVNKSILSVANSSCKRLRIDKKDKFYVTKNVSYKNSKITPNYSGVTAQESVDEERFFNESLYIINEETLEKITYFKVNKKNGQVKNYYVQAVLNPTSSTVEYSKCLQQQIKCSPPTFKSVTLTFIIDANGYVTSFNATDTLNIVLLMFNADAKTSINYVVSNINEQLEENYTGF